MTAIDLPVTTLVPCQQRGRRRDGREVHSSGSPCTLHWAACFAGVFLIAAAGAGCGKDSSSPVGAPTTAGSNDPRAASSDELIANAVAAGELSVETGLVYQVFAAFGDSRLPAQFQGPSTSGGTSTLGKVSESFDTFSDKTQAILEPFLLPPSAKGSWHDLPTAAANATETAREPGTGTKGAGPSIAWTKVTAVGGKVTIWSEDRYAGEDGVALEIADELDGNIWPKIFDELRMNTPMSDAEEPNNGGDESLDIYLVHLGATSEFGLTTEPLHACASGPHSVYITVNTQQRRSALFPSVAHEVMHAAQGAYARTDCKSRWWEEATATWVEDVTYPTPVQIRGQEVGNTEQAYAQSFLDTPDASLEFDEKGSTHSYGAYLLPFMVDRKYMKRTFVSRTFKLIESFTTLRAIQTALTDVTPGGFKEVWPEFAKYNWNQKPVVDYETWDGVTAQPEDSARIKVYPGADKLPIDTTVNHLAAKYLRINVDDPEVRQFRIDNLIVGDNVRGGHVWLIPKIGGTWREPEVLSSEKVYCRDVAEDNVEELILVISNSEHDEAYQLPDGQIQLSARPQCPGGFSGWVREVITIDHESTTYWPAIGGFATTTSHKRVEHTWTVIGTSPTASPFGGEQIETRWHGTKEESSSSRDNITCKGETSGLFTSTGEGTATQNLTAFVIEGESIQLSQADLPVLAITGTWETVGHECDGETYSDSGPAVIEYGGFQPLMLFSSPSDTNHFNGSETRAHDERAGSDTITDYTDLYDITVTWDLTRIRGR
jgi:hypothetical protein